MRCYTSALRACLRDDSGGARGEHMALLYSNRAHAHSKMGDHLKVGWELAEARGRLGVWLKVAWWTGQRRYSWF